MAETLGSLVDKLSIKNLRLWHLDEVLEKSDPSDPKVAELQGKRKLVVQQAQDLMQEIDTFLAAALEGKVKIRDEKVKLYLNRNVEPTDVIRQLGPAISELALRNIRLWHLEDDARRSDLPDAAIVKIKRQIDSTNQERNDLMDKVDQILWNESPQNKQGDAAS